LDARKIGSANMLERLNKVIRRRTRVAALFPNQESYVQLGTIYPIEYAKDWLSYASISASSPYKDLLNKVA
jgi:putative transposase